MYLPSKEPICIIFGPRYTDALWQKSVQDEPMIKAVCCDCQHELILRAAASEIIKSCPVICTDCKNKQYRATDPPIVTLADIEYAVEARLRAARN